MFVRVNGDLTVFHAVLKNLIQDFHSVFQGNITQLGVEKKIQLETSFKALEGKMNNLNNSFIRENQVNIINSNMKEINY